MTLQARVAAVDGLRALALLPVVAVNWVGYAALPQGGPLGAPQPGDSPAALLVLWFMATFVAGKGIAMLSFLFGYGQGLSRRARGPEAWVHRGKRMQRLLVLGLIHGFLIYCGDILLTYALCGWIMLGWADLPLRRLKQRLKLLIGLDLLLNFGMLGYFIVAGAASPAAPASSLAAPASLLSWWVLNGSSFFTTALGVALLGLPPFLALMTAGLMAARLRIFSHRRWRAPLRRLARRWLLPALLVNLLWGWSFWQSLRGDDLNRQFLSLCFYLYAAATLGLALLPRLLAREALLQRVLAPLGRHTLSLYLGSSVLSFLLFSGAGLHLQLGTVASFALALAYWGAALLLAPRLRGRRLPLEAWVAR